MSRTERLRGRQASRGQTPSCLLSFLKNFARAARLMHSSLRAFASQDDLIQEAIRLYIMGMTTCLETYYRDLYIALHEADEQLLRKLFEGDKHGARLARLRASEPKDIPDSELASELAKFQNLSGIDQALSEILKPQRYVEVLSSTEFLCVIPSRRADLASMKIWPDWQSQFSRVFDCRHEFTHDANKDCDVTRKDIAFIESTALVVPQLPTFLMAQRLGASGEVLSMNTVPAILLVDDLIADDWQVVPEDI
jgi:hypothetical protein